MRIMSGWLDGLHGLSAQSDSAAQWAFFKVLFNFLDGEVEVFRDNLLGETLQWVSGVSLSLLTIWILIQGYRIVTGQSRESMMGLVTQSLRSILIVGAATTMAFGSSDLYGMFTDGLPREITHVVTGKDDPPEDMIDQSLDKMELAMAGIDALSATGDVGLKEDKDKAMLFTGVGVAGPSVVGGAMLLLYKLAMALFVGLGPLFIISLLFEQTKQMFGKWLYYGIGTLFSLGVLSFMVAVAMKMVLAVSTAFATQYLVALGTHASTAGVSSMAMQQGGMGLVLTVLLVMTPPMAAQFFQGTLGQFAAYSAFGAVGRGTRADSAGRMAGTPGYQFSTVPRDMGRTSGQEGSGDPRPAGSGNNLAMTGTKANSYAPQQDVIKKGSDAARGDRG